MKNSIIPTNKLFEVFLSNYGIDDIWLFEGLIKWGQNLTYEIKSKNYKYTLPRSLDELDGLFSKPSQSEYFWLELTKQCDKYTIFVREFLENYQSQLEKFEYKQQLDNKRNNFV